MFVVSLPPFVRDSSSKQIRRDAAIMELIQSFHRFPPMKFTEVVPNTFFTLRTFLWQWSRWSSRMSAKWVHFWTSLNFWQILLLISPASEWPWYFPPCSSLCSTNSLVPQINPVADEAVLLQICKAVAAHPHLKAFSMEDIDRILYAACLDQLVEIFASNFNLLNIFLSPSNNYESDCKFDWIGNRNKIYKKQQRFKLVKPVQS